MRKIDSLINDLKTANNRLKEAVEKPKDEFIRDSVIQRFEFTFELSWKTMKAYNVMMGQECYSPRNCIRIAVQNGIIKEVNSWFEYLEHRNNASHIYNEKMADEIYEAAKKFVVDVEELIKMIEKNE